jgi:YbbR domain-containing protein
MDRLLRSSVALRIIALILACILWLAVNAPSGNANGSPTDGIAEKFTRTVQIEVSPDMVVKSQDMASATIQVRSTMWSVLSLSNQMANVQLVADAEGLNAGKHTIPVIAMGMPNVGNMVVTINPSMVNVVLEKKVTMMKPVKVLLQGHPVKGATVGTISVDNPSVQVSGAASNVAKVAEVVGTVSVSGASSSISKAVSLTAIDAKGQPVSDVNVSPGTASITVPVQTSIQSISLFPQIVGQPPEGLAVSGVQLSATSVKLYGSLSQSLPEKLMVPIDVTGLQASGPVKVKIPLLPGADKVDPDTVTANVTIEPSEAKMFTDIPIQVLNLPSGMTVSLTPSTVSVRVTGPKSVVDGMTEKDVVASIDGSGFKRGDNTGTISVQLPNWVNTTQLTAEKVTVQVS